MHFVLIDFMLLILQKLNHLLLIEDHLNVVGGGVPDLAMTNLVLADLLGLRVVRDRCSATVIAFLANEAATLISEVVGASASHSRCPTFAICLVPSTGPGHLAKLRSVRLRGPLIVVAGVWDHHLVLFW